MTKDSATYVDMNTKLTLKRPTAEDRLLLKDVVAVPERVLVRKRHLNDSDVTQWRKMVSLVEDADEEFMARALR